MRYSLLQASKCNGPGVLRRKHPINRPECQARLYSPLGCRNTHVSRYEGDGRGRTERASLRGMGHPIHLTFVPLSALREDLFNLRATYPLGSGSIPDRAHRSKSTSHKYGEQGCSPYSEESDGLDHERSRMAD